MFDVDATEASGDRCHRIDNGLVRLALQFPERDLPYERLREAMADSASLEAVLETEGFSPIHYDEFADGDVDAPVEAKDIEDRPFITSHVHKRGLEVACSSQHLVDSVPSVREDGDGAHGLRPGVVLNLNDARKFAWFERGTPSSETVRRKSGPGAI
ncbi:hypothetical protein GS429_04980 [Natronorubrum sp. JWXQ-INN-674]|uniref:Uncharacterized protein n=1 Tax=Natronorubrum halalkaliphilum TaxID=2691917 RepID=A0A6B0VK97_9EURY|nr:hypothetical protein [Natronorubrum halalkaliphilum]MXV61426.1 hypothetical protein [Natronorubrum halalkaliphilum]